MLQPDALALKFLLINRWQQMRAVLAQHLANALVGTLILILLLWLTRDSSFQWPSFLQNTTVYAWRDWLILASTVLLGANLLAKRKTRLAAQTQDWLASTPAKPNSRARFVAVLTQLDALAWWPALALLALALQFPWPVALLGSAACVLVVAIVSTLVPRPWMESDRANNSSRQTRDTATPRRFQRQATLAAATANWWRAGLPVAAVRARWWFLPLLALPAGLSTSSLVWVFAALFVGLQIIQQLQAAFPFAKQIGRLQLSTPVSAFASYQGLCMQFLRHSAIYWLAAVMLAFLLPLPWHVLGLLLMAALLISAWQLHLAFAVRLRGSKLPVLSLHYSTWLIATAAIATAFLPLVIIWQCLFLYQHGARPQDVE
jgi:hypothetical protein